MDIYPILSSIKHNIHYLNRYINFLRACKQRNTYSELSLKERHHICPKSLFPEYKNLKIYKWNEIILSPKQHFIAHLILTKALPSLEMNSAFFFMSSYKGIKIKSSMYEEIALNSYSKIKPDSTRKKMSDAAVGLIMAYNTITGGNEKVTKEIFESSKHLVGIVKYKSVNSYRKFKPDHSEIQSKAQILSKQNKAQILSKQNKIQCPHCQINTDISNFKRWHGDNCRSLPSNKQTTVYNHTTGDRKFVKVSELDLYISQGYVVKSIKSKL
jgi:hypothetical protein